MGTLAQKGSVFQFGSLCKKVEVRGCDSVRKAVICKTSYTAWKYLFCHLLEVLVPQKPYIYVSFGTFWNMAYQGLRENFYENIKKMWENHKNVFKNIDRPCGVRTNWIAIKSILMLRLFCGVRTGASITTKNSLRLRNQNWCETKLFRVDKDATGNYIYTPYAASKESIPPKVSFPFNFTIDN